MPKNALYTNLPHIFSCVSMESFSFKYILQTMMQPNFKHKCPHLRNSCFYTIFLLHPSNLFLLFFFTFPLCVTQVLFYSKFYIMYEITAITLFTNRYEAFHHNVFFINEMCKKKAALIYLYRKTLACFFFKFFFFSFILLLCYLIGMPLMRRDRILLSGNIKSLNNKVT